MGKFNRLVLVSIVGTLASFGCKQKESAETPAPAATVAPVEAEGPTRVQTLVGIAEMNRIGNSKKTELKVGMKLVSGVELSTGQESSLGLALANGTLYTLTENSSVVMDSVLLDGAQQKARFQVKSGNLAFNVQKLVAGKTDIEFRTRTMTAAVRGTSGEIIVVANKTTVALRTGEVAVHNLVTNRDTILRPMQTLTVDDKGAWSLKATVDTAAPVVAPAVVPAAVPAVVPPKPTTQSPQAVAPAPQAQQSAPVKKPGIDSARATNIKNSLEGQNNTREVMEQDGQAVKQGYQKSGDSVKADMAKGKQRELNAMEEARKKMGMGSGSDIRRQMEEDAKKAKSSGF